MRGRAEEKAGEPFAPARAALISFPTRADGPVQVFWPDPILFDNQRRTFANVCPPARPPKAIRLRRVLNAVESWYPLPTWTYTKHQPLTASH